MKAVVPIILLLLFSTAGSAQTPLAVQQPDPPLRETCGESIYTDSQSSNTARLKVKISITPPQRQLTINQTDVLLVCITNPIDNNRTINPVISFRINASDDGEVYIIGRHYGIATKNHVGQLPLNEPKKTGKGRAVAPGEIAPGEVLQYTIIATEFEKKARYGMNVRVDVPIFPNGTYRKTSFHKQSYPTTTCPPSYAISTTTDTIMHFLRGWGKLLITLATLLLTALMLAVMVLRTERIRTKLQKIRDND